ncbi:MAG: hypothetical protein ACPG6B_01450 [Oceanihabitans sp.]
MDKLIISGNGFGGTNEFLTFLENLSAEQITGLVAALGNNVIVTGMVPDNGSLTSGFLIYNNELLPFEASAIGATIVIEEIITEAGYDIANTGNFSTILPVWKTRKAKFGSPGDPNVVASFSFTNLTRLTTMQQLRDTKLESLLEGQLNIIWNLQTVSLLPTGEFTSATVIGNNTWYREIEVELTFPEIPLDYFPVFTTNYAGVSVQGTTNIYIVSQTATTLRLYIWSFTDTAIPVAEYLKSITINLIQK